MKLTKQQVKGTKFEIWLEILFRKLGHQNVRRNVEYHKARFLFRQVDISYDAVKRGKLIRLYPVVAEAKYSSNGPIQYKLRKGLVYKKGQMVNKIDNLVDECYERKKFTGARIAKLITNHEFDDEVKFYAKKCGIRVLEGRELQRLYEKVGGKMKIDKSIRKIDLSRHNLHKSILYLS